EETVNGLICLGYPLSAMGDRTKLRDQVLRDLSTPILFVQGTRDPLCPLDLLGKVRAQMNAPNFLHTIEGGDHSLHVRKKDLGSANRSAQRVITSENRFAAHQIINGGHLRRINCRGRDRVGRVATGTDCCCSGRNGDARSRDRARARRWSCARRRSWSRG